MTKLEDKIFRDFHGVQLVSINYAEIKEEDLLANCMQI